METHVRVPDPMMSDGNIASNWQIWRDDFIIFMKVTGHINEPNEIRANRLKNLIGRIGINAIQNMTFDNSADKDNMDVLLAKLEEVFNPPKKEVVERYHFFTRAMKSDESIEQYINRLRVCNTCGDFSLADFAQIPRDSYYLQEIAKTCNFQGMTDSFIRDKIILDTHDVALRKKFFEVDNLNLQKLVTIYHEHNVNEKMKQLKTAKENKVESTNVAQNVATTTNVKKGHCWRCGCQHQMGKCPAWGSKCTKCGDLNHFTQYCKGPNANPKTKGNDKVKNLLNPAKSQTKDVLKNNEKLWNNHVVVTNATKDSTKESMNKTISFPEVPMVLHGATNLAYNRPSALDVTSDFVLIDTNPLKTCNANKNSHYNATTRQSIHSLKNSQCYNSNTNRSKIGRSSPNLYNIGTSVLYSRPTSAGYSWQSRDDLNSHPRTNVLHLNQKFKQNRKQNGDACVLF